MTLMKLSHNLVRYTSATQDKDVLCLNSSAKIKRQMSLTNLIFIFLNYTCLMHLG